MDKTFIFSKCPCCEHFYMLGDFTGHQQGRRYTAAQLDHEYSKDGWVLDTEWEAARA